MRKSIETQSAGGCLFVCFFLLVFSYVAFGQSGKSAPPARATAAATIQEVPKDQQIQILKLLNGQKDEQLEAASLNARIQQLQTQYHDADAQIAAAKVAALKDANLDPAKYDVDVVQMRFVAKPGQAPPAKK